MKLAFRISISVAYIAASVVGCLALKGENTTTTEHTVKATVEPTGTFSLKDGLTEMEYYVSDDTELVFSVTSPRTVIQADSFIVMLTLDRKATQGGLKRRTRSHNGEWGPWVKLPPIIPGDYLKSNSTQLSVSAPGLVCSHGSPVWWDGIGYYWVLRASESGNHRGLIKLAPPPTIQLSDFPVKITLTESILTFPFDVDVGEVWRREHTMWVIISLGSVLAQIPLWCPFVRKELKRRRRMKRTNSGVSPRPHQEQRPSARIPDGSGQATEQERRGDNDDTSQSS